MSGKDHGPKTAGLCGHCGSRERNRYFRGKLLTVADYEVEQGYMIGSRRLLNRVITDWGVASGFGLRFEEGRLAVGPGVALDRCGRELVACDRTVLACGRDALWLKQGECGYEAEDPPRPPEPRAQADRARRYLLSAHYAEAAAEGVRVDDGCGGGTCEANHLCETVVYSLTPVEHCPDGLADCRPPLFPDLPCVGKAGPAEAAPIPEHRPPLAELGDRGPQARLCAWSQDRLGGFDPCRLGRLGRAGGVAVDLDAGVPLACVLVGFDECGEAVIVEVEEECRPRRLAPTNRALFDLVRGCDLVRIKDVGWREWLEPPFRGPFSRFAKMFDKPPARQGKARRRPGDSHFWLCFTGPVRAESLTPDVFAMTLLQRDENEAVLDVRRVPIDAVAIAPTSEGDPAGTTRSCRAMIRAAFVHGEIDAQTADDDDDATGFDRETGVEIEVRCDFIVDHLGQMVAGGGRFPPSRGTVPGGRFLSAFTVVPDGDWAKQQAAKSTDQ